MNQNEIEFESLNNIEMQNESLIKDYGTLIISEVKNKVFLPYTAKEIQELIDSKDNTYKTAEEVIENVFVKPFEYYRNQFTARFKETVELITKREEMSLKDGIDLGAEMLGKRYLHPAIISACKNLDELNVYLDCLDKNELDDFKIFNIQYEMHPMVVKERGKIIQIKTDFFSRIINFIKRIFVKKETKHAK